MGHIYIYNVFLHYILQTSYILFKEFIIRCREHIKELIYFKIFIYFYLKSRVTGKVRNREGERERVRERSSRHLLVDSPDNHNSPQSGPPTWWAGPKHAKSIILHSPGCAPAKSWIRSWVARAQTRHFDMWSRHPKQRLKCYATILTSKELIFIW